MPFETISLLIEISAKERNIQVFNDAKIYILRVFSREYLYIVRQTEI